MSSGAQKNNLCPSSSAAFDLCFSALTRLFGYVRNPGIGFAAGLHESDLGSHHIELRKPEELFGILRMPYISMGEDRLQSQPSSILYGPLFYTAR